MDLRRDDRGQAIQVGAVLLFAMLVVAMSVYQAQVVPQENAEIEWDSYLDASSDMTKLRNDMLGAAATGDQRGTTVTTGTTYPARVFFVNPPPATGRIRTGAAENLSLSNVKSTSRHANVDRYLQSESSTLEYQTRDIEFVPGYHEIGDRVAPVVVANGFTYRNYSTPVALTTQTIIQGNRLTFITVAGDLDAGGITTPITTDPVSAHTRTVTVTNRTSDPLVVTVPTPIPAATWEQKIVAGQLDPGATNPDRYVTAVTPGPRPNTVNITLEPGARYELRLGRVELHEKSDVSEAGSPPARYLVSHTDRQVKTNAYGRVAVDVESRDRFNNPVSNAEVTFNASVGTFETREGSVVTDIAPAQPGTTVKTNEDGQALVYYNATGFVGNHRVTAKLGTGGSVAAEKQVTYSVRNTFTNESGGVEDTDINPGNFVVLEGARYVTTPDDRVRVTWTNQGRTATNVTAMRFAFYFEADKNAKVIAADVHEVGGPSFLHLPINSNFNELTTPRTFPANQSSALEFSFDSISGGTVSNYKPAPADDYFVIMIEFDDAYTVTYFVTFTS